MNNLFENIIFYFFMANFIFFFCVFIYSIKFFSYLKKKYPETKKIVGTFRERYGRPYLLSDPTIQKIVQDDPYLKRLHTRLVKLRKYYMVFFLLLFIGMFIGFAFLLIKNT